MGAVKFEKTGSFLSPIKAVAMITMLEHELSDTLISEFNEALDQIEADENLRSVLVTADGEEFARGKASDNAKALLDRLRSFELPVLGAINGPALDAGFDLALVFDFRYASDNADFGWPNQTGILSENESDELLKQITLNRLPKSLRGEKISAEEAKIAGILNKVLAKDEFLSTAKFTATKMSDNAPLAVRGAKKTMNLAFSVPIEEGNNAEVEIMRKCNVSEDIQEGIKAVFEKRKPRFSGK